MDGEKSEETSAASGMQQGTVLGPLIYLLHINDIGNDLSEGTHTFLLLMIAEDSLPDAEKLEHDLQYRAKWSETWQIAFIVTKCHV